MEPLTIQTVVSGSSGNMTLVTCGRTRVLVDLGLPSIKKIEEAIEKAGLSMDEIDYVLVSHRHSDHIGYSGLRVCELKGIEFLAGPDTADFLFGMYARRGSIRRLRDLAVVVREDHTYLLGDLSVTPFLLPHDVETFGFRFEVNNHGPHDRGRAPGNRSYRPSVALATDLGHVPRCLLDYFRGVDAALIEANYEEELLLHSERSPQNKARIVSDLGHLSNSQAAEFLLRLADMGEMPQSVVLVHLSEDHNRPEVALSRVKSVLGSKGYELKSLTAAPRYHPGECIAADQSRRELGRVRKTGGV